MSESQNNEASEIIDAIGGTSATARLCEVSDAAVSQWRTEGIPNPRLMFLRLARPDVFMAIEQSKQPTRRATDPEPSPGHPARNLPSAKGIMSFADQAPLTSRKKQAGPP